MTTGYLQIVHDYGHIMLTGFLLLVNPLAWMVRICTEKITIGVFSTFEILN
jgi:hypothetical protein